MEYQSQRTAELYYLRCGQWIRIIRIPMLHDSAETQQHRQLRRDQALQDLVLDSTNPLLIRKDPRR